MEKEYQTTCIRMPLNLWKEIDKLSRRSYVSKTKIISSLLEMAIEKGLANIYKDRKVDENS